jgi:P27 family predicted phage terminase small subunit
MGVLTAIDQSALAAYCEAYEEAQACSKYLNEHGLTFRTPSGYIQQRPEVAIRNKAWDRVDKFAAQLGIGAAHRSKIEVKKRDDSKSPLEEIIEANRRR